MVSLAEKLTHPFISYSLNYEDVILRRLFTKTASGFYIDIGAAHPIIDNDLYGLYQLGWRGVNVEANQASFLLLQQDRSRDLNINAAVADRDGMTLTFFEADNAGLSTCDRERARELEQEGHRVVQRAMTTMSLATICAEAALPHIDILKVDVEGFEEAVLTGNEWQQYRPSVILLETTFPETQVRRPSGVGDILRREGYRHIHFDGLNDFYASSDFAVPDNVSLPVSVFDGFKRREQVDAETRAAKAETELLDVRRQLKNLAAMNNWLLRIAGSSMLGSFDQVDSLLTDPEAFGLLRARDEQ